MAVKARCFLGRSCGKREEEHSRVFCFSQSSNNGDERVKVRKLTWLTYESRKTAKDARLTAAHWNKKERCSRGIRPLDSFDPVITHFCVCIASSLKISDLKTEASWASVGENEHLEARECKFRAREKSRKHEYSIPRLQHPKNLNLL